jgi:hypothetical protein
MQRLYRCFAAGFAEGGPAAGALTLALVYAAIPPLKGIIEAFDSAYVVQDDARQFIFWMRRWLDPTLFAGDLNARYWESVTPPGFKALFWLPAQLGLDPMLLNKLLPPPLGLAIAWLAFRLAYRIVPVPAAAFVASTLTVFFMWLMEDTASGTPRAFAVPLFLGFLCCLVERRTMAAAAVGLLQGLFYPQMSLVYLGVVGLSLLRWRDGRPDLARLREPWTRALVCGAATVAGLVPFLLSSSEFGPAISAAEIRDHPAFQPGGRSEFFLPDPIDYYLCGVRSGLLPVQWGCYSAYEAGLGVAPVLAIGALLFALGLPLWLASRSRERGPGRPSRAVWWLVAAVVAGTALHALAHLLLFRLHLPARYGQHTLRAVSMVALGLALAPAFLGAARWSGAGPAWRRGAIAAAGLALFGGLFAATAALPVIPRMEYEHGRHPALYAWFAGTPRESIVASLSGEADNVPTFGPRVVLATREYAIPYHVGYIGELRRRTEDLIAAQYAPDPAAIRDYIARYEVDILLLDADAFDPDHVRTVWWQNEYPRAAQAALAQLQAGETPALATLFADCGERPDPAFVVLRAACLLQSR